MTAADIAGTSGVRLTDEDVRLLGYQCRYTAVTAPMLMATLYHEVSRSNLFRRLNRLKRAGLVEDIKTGPSNLGRPRNVHALWVPTKRGYAESETGLTHKTPAPGTLRHTLAVAEIGLAFEVSGYQVITDREMRSDIARWKSNGAGPVPTGSHWLHLGEDANPYMPAPTWRAKRAGVTHTPDLVLVTDDLSSHAFEIELTLKNDSDLRNILHGFGKTRKYASVTYYVNAKAIENKINKVVSELPMHERPDVEIRTYVAGHSPKVGA